MAYYAYETNQEGTIPVYRFYNSEVDAHFYTASIEERNSTIDNLPNYQLEGQNQDGEVFYVLPISEDSAI